MVLLLKQWKSRSSPGFAGGVKQEPIHNVEKAAAETYLAAAYLFERESAPAGDAGWSSPVARQAHNLKVAGSNRSRARTISVQLDKAGRDRMLNQHYAFERALQERDHLVDALAGSGADVVDNCIGGVNRSVAVPILLIDGIAIADQQSLDLKAV